MTKAERERLFWEYLDRYRRPLMNLCARHALVPPREDPQDVFSDVCVGRGYVAATERYDGTSSFDGFMLSTLRWELYKHTYSRTLRKSARRWEQLEGPELVAAFQSHEHHPADGVEAILSRLPEHHAVVLRAVYIDGFTRTALADAWGETRAAVRRRVNDALEAARELGRDEDEAGIPTSPAPRA